MRAYSVYPWIKISAFLGRNSQKVLRFLDRVLVEIFLTTLCLSILGIILMPFFLLFLILGRIRIVGIKNLRSVPLENVLFVGNHPSLIEPFLLPVIIALVRGLVDVRAIPWQTSDRKNFQWVTFGILPFKVFHCFPVEKDDNGERNDRRVYRFLRRMIPKARILIFSEGTRSSKAVAAGKKFLETAFHHVQIGEPKEGIGGLLRLDSPPQILPILVVGAEKTMPVGSHIGHAFLRIWSNPISIVFGELVTLTVPANVPKRQRQWYTQESLRRVAALDREHIPTVWGALFARIMGREK